MIDTYAGAPLNPKPIGKGDTPMVCTFLGEPCEHPLTVMVTRTLYAEFRKKVALQNHLTPFSELLTTDQAKQIVLLKALAEYLL